MNDFVDLPGASGATYRFRAVAEGEEPRRIAGNFAYLRPKLDGFSVVLVGMTDDLSAVSRTPPSGAPGDAKLFTRLNVARAAREAEHADLVGRYGEDLVGGPPAG